MSMAEEHISEEELRDTARRNEAIAQVEALLEKAKRAPDGRISVEALAQVLRPGSLVALGAQAPAHLQIVRETAVPEYAPDLEVYTPEPKNNKHAAMLETLRRTPSAKMVVECRAKDGLRESFTLLGYEAHAYIMASAAERREFLNERIFESRWGIAREAAQRIKDHPGQPFAKLVRPHEEAFMLGFGLLAEGERLVPKARGGFKRVKDVVLSERALPLLERSADARLREDLFNTTFDFSPPAFASNATAPYLDSEFLPNWGYGTAQTVTVTDIWDEQAKCEYAYRHDPVAKKGVHVIRDFTLDRGLKVQCKSEKIQTVVDEFWTRERMKRRLKQWAVVSSKLGELFVRRWPIGNGKLKVRSLRADTIVEIITDAEDFEEVYSYIQAYETRFTMYAADAPKETEPRYIFRDIPAKSIRHYKLNCDDYDLRGRSDLFCYLPWGKAMRDYLYTVVAKEQTAAAYIWDYEVDGGQNDVQKVANALPKGKVDPGTAHVHNKKVKVEAVGADPKNTTGANSPYEGLLNHCSIALEIPREYLGSGSRATRANTLVATDPTSKRMAERQDWIVEIVEDTVNDVIDEAIRFDRSLASEDRAFTVLTPAIMKADAKQRVELIAKGRSMGWLSQRTAAEKFYAELEDENLDFDEQVQQIKGELDKPELSAISKSEEQIFTAFFLGNEEKKQGAPVTGQPLSPRPSGPAAGDIGGPAAQAAAKAAGKGGDASPSSAAGAASIQSDQG